MSIFPTPLNGAIVAGPSGATFDTDDQVAFILQPDEPGHKLAGVRITRNSDRTYLTNISIKYTSGSNIYWKCATGSEPADKESSKTAYYPTENDDLEISGAAEDQQFTYLLLSAGKERLMYVHLQATSGTPNQKTEITKDGKAAEEAYPGRVIMNAHPVPGPCDTQSGRYMDMPGYRFIGLHGVMSKKDKNLLSLGPVYVPR